MAETNAVTIGTVLSKIAPYSPAALRASIETYIKKHAPTYGVTTPARMAAFLAQTAHETDGFKTLEEYASGQAYEGRAALGNTQPGDGVKFKGRGIIQTTGRANYKRVSQVLFNDDRLLTNPKILLQPEYAVLAGFIYWKDHNLNTLADKGDFVGLTRAINGGERGIEDRQKKWAVAKAIIALNPTFFFAELLKKKVPNYFSNIGSAAADIGDGFRFFFTGK